jgi:uncharacterized protein YdgA (DUF945 family)
MRKYLLSLLIIPVALVLIPLGMGFTAKDYVENQLEKLPITKNIDIKVSNFKRGWFSSTADMVVEINNQSLIYMPPTPTGQKPAPLALVSNVRIKHGPILWDNSTPGQNHLRFGRLMVIAPLTLTADNTEALGLSKIIQNQALIQAWAKQSFLGSTEVHLMTPKINYKDAQGTIVWNGISTDLKIGSSNNHVKANVNFAPIDLKLNQGGYLKTGDIHFTTNSTRNEHGLWFGDNTLKISDFDALSAKRNHILFSGLNVDANSNSGNQTITAHIKADMNKLDVNDMVYGPVHLEYTLDNVDESAVAALHDFAKNLPQDVSFFATLDQAAVKDQIEKLLARGPEMKVENFHLESDKGSFSLNAKLNMDKGAGANTLEQFSQNWTNQIDAEVNMKAAPGVSRKIVSVAYLGSLGNIANFIALAPNADKNAIDAMIDKEAQKILDRLTEQKYLSLNDNQYNLNFTYKKGSALINGQSVPSFMKHAAPTAAPEAPGVAPNLAPAPGASANSPAKPIEKGNTP